MFTFQVLGLCGVGTISVSCLPYRIHNIDGTEIVDWINQLYRSPQWLIMIASRSSLSFRILFSWQERVQDDAYDVRGQALASSVDSVARPGLLQPQLVAEFNLVLTRTHHRTRNPVLSDTERSRKEKKHWRHVYVLVDSDRSQNKGFGTR